MAKIVLVCLRNPSREAAESVEYSLGRFLATLRPDHLNAAPPVVTTDHSGLWLGVFNPVDAGATVRRQSAYVGWLADAAAQWWRVGTPTPSGSHAMFRGSPAAIEVLADYAGSRTVWTAHTDHMLIASTSQRAIPWFLGSFEANPDAQAWMLSSGTLGPQSAGWDVRARRLGPGGMLRLDRSTWRLTRREPPVRFDIDSAPDQVHTQRLREALDSAVGDMQLDRSRWVLPLSGGYDSRAILLLMRNRGLLRTVTWGSREALARSHSDAYVAQLVATKVGTHHRYHATDLSTEAVDRLMDRYLVAGDGCTDGLWAYLDGFETWRSFYEQGVRGVIRGDHGFGPGPSRPPATYDEARQFVGLTRWQDYASMPALADLKLDWFGAQDLPVSLEPNPGESPLDWRDRLYQGFRVPAYIAAQSDLKAAYVEVASPFFAREILKLTRTHPAHLRRAKDLFRKVMAPYDVGIPYAKESALVRFHEALATPRVLEWLADQLGSRRLRGAFSAQFADYLLQGLHFDARRRAAVGWKAQVRRRIRLAIPNGLRPSWLMSVKRKPISLRLITMRACIASITMDRLSRDARVGAQTAGAPPERRHAMPSALAG